MDDILLLCKAEFYQQIEEMLKRHFVTKATGSLNDTGCKAQFLGRMFNWEILDMIELGIDQYLGLDDIKGNKKGIGHKPMMLFQGDEF